MSVNTVVPIFAAKWLVTLLCNREFVNTNLDVRFFIVLLSLFVHLSGQYLKFGHGNFLEMAVVSL